MFVGLLRGGVGLKKYGHFQNSAVASYFQVNNVKLQYQNKFPWTSVALLLKKKKKIEKIFNIFYSQQSNILPFVLLYSKGIFPGSMC